MVRGLAAVAALACVAVLSAQAQVEPVDFSIKGGVNFADLAIDPDPGNDGGKYLRFGGGGSLGMNLSPNLSITTDFLYLMKGKKVTYVSGNELDKVELDSYTELDYIVISPNFRVSAGGKGTSPYFLMGPEIGFLVKAQTRLEDEETSGFEQDVKDEYKSTDFGLNFGAGLEIPTGGSSFFIEGRYSLGLADIAENAGSDTETSATVNTRGIYAFAGVRF